MLDCADAEVMLDSIFSSGMLQGRLVVCTNIIQFHMTVLWLFAD